MSEKYIFIFNNLINNNIFILYIYIQYLIKFY